MTKGWVKLLIGGTAILLLASCATALTPADEVGAPETEPAGEPVGGQPAETMTIVLFFGNERLNPDQTDCSQVFPVERVVPTRADVARAVLEQLFGGPTEVERSAGYVSSFSSATTGILLSVRIEGDTAYVNLIDIRPLMPAVSSSCGSAAFFAEVERTLSQAAAVNRVIYAIEGDPALFYEWVQLGCDAANDDCDASPFIGNE